MAVQGTDIRSSSGRVAESSSWGCDSCRVLCNIQRQGAACVCLASDVRKELVKKTFLSVCVYQSFVQTYVCCLISGEFAANVH